MGIYVIRVPDIGEGIAEVELVVWHVAMGQQVKEDQPVADVMTDKATVEIPCHVNGKVIGLGAGVGEMIAVGAELIRLEVEGEGNWQPEAETAAGAMQSEAAAAVSVSNSRPKLSENAENQALAAHVIEAQAPKAVVSAPTATKATSKRPVPMARKEGERPLASPSVRRRALDMGIDLRLVAGSGPAGQISHADLEAFADGQGQLLGGHPLYVERHGQEQIPVIGLRRKIAQKMQEAKRRIPHFSYVEELDVTELELLRHKLNALHGSTRGKLTLLPFLARAMVLALRQFPQINARYDDEEGVVTRFEAVHLGIAAQTDSGLMVPVLPHAESLDLWAIAAGIARLAEGAKSGKLTREELSGSTITLTSLGALGGIASTPVINHPEVAIVGVNRIVERPMLRGGQVVARQLMNLSSSFDHRVVDGMDAAQFIQAVRALLETPALLFVD